MASKDSPSELFNGMDPKGLATLLQNENLQIIAMALSLMEPEKAAKTLSLFPKRLRAEVTLRIASEEQDTDLADQVKDMLFVFEDLLNIDDRAIQLILKEVSTDDLAIALKTAPEALKEKIFRNMSQRAARILKDEVEAKGPVRVSDVQKAQKNVVNVARRLDKEGKIILGKGGEKIVL